MAIKIVVDTSVFISALISSKGISVNKLIEELSTIALAEFDTHTRFKAMAATGNPEVGLSILAKLDALTE